MSIRVLRSGLLTTFQDLGRIGFQRDGVIVSGAMDSFAHRIANILVGNEETEATMEITMLGPILRFEEDVYIAICGGEFEVTLDEQTVPLWQPFHVKNGQTLSINRCIKGCRAYIAVAGGFDIPKIMNSQSTYLLAKVGGFKGRELQKEDVIPLKRLGGEKLRKGRWGVSYKLQSYFGDKEQTIRVIRGENFKDFTTQSQRQFFQQSYTITTQSNRMGYRLDGDLLKRSVDEDVISSAVTFGTIQVPPEGKPIILMADRQTTGGYPKIGQVIAVDLPKLAQLKPGDRITFQNFSFTDAQRCLIELEKEIQLLKKQITYLSGV